jgi:quinol monooxygenase YgiN
VVLVINDDRVSDVEAYLPLARAFAEDSEKNEKGCRSMRVCMDPETEGRVVYVSAWDSEEDFKASVGGEIFSRHISAMGRYFLQAEDTILQIV